MNRIALIVAVLALLFLSACRDRDVVPPDPQTAVKPAPTVLDDQFETMDKARAVEQDVLDNARKTDEAMEAAEGG